MAGLSSLVYNDRLVPAEAVTHRTPSETAWRPQTTLPAVERGQLWVVELPAVAPALWPQERRLLAAANVVIYDRSLEALVAAALPLGGYAEPASAGRPDAAAERCRSFVRDGWSVVRLVAGGTAAGMREQRFGNLVERGRADGAELPVQVFSAGAGGAYQAAEIPLGRVAEIAASRAGSRLIALFPASGSGTAPALSAVAANGLAG